MPLPYRYPPQVQNGRSFGVFIPTREAVTKLIRAAIRLGFFPPVAVSISTRYSFNLEDTTLDAHCYPGGVRAALCLLFVVSCRRRLPSPRKPSLREAWLRLVDFCYCLQSEPRGAESCRKDDDLCFLSGGWPGMTARWVADGLMRLGSAPYGPRLVVSGGIAIQNTVGCGTVFQGHVAVAVSVRAVADSRDGHHVRRNFGPPSRNNPVPLFGTDDCSSSALLLQE